jgi:hypothetical protein
MWAIAASPLVVTTPIMNCVPVNVSEHAPSQGLPVTDAAVAESAGCTVTLNKQLSGAACTANVTFGCDGKDMWTKGGCRGEFICNGLTTLDDVDGGWKCFNPFLASPIQRSF